MEHPNFNINAANTLNHATALDLAIMNGDASVVHTVLQDKRLKVTSSLHTLEMLLDNKASPAMLAILLADPHKRFDITEARMIAGHSPLRLIVEDENLEMLDVVLSSSIEISRKAASSAMYGSIHRVMNSSMHENGQNSRVVLNKLLGDNRFKAGLNYNTIGGETILMTALRINEYSKNDEVINLLKAHGALCSAQFDDHCDDISAASGTGAAGVETIPLLTAYHQDEIQPAGVTHETFSNSLS